MRPISYFIPISETAATAALPKLSKAPIGECYVELLEACIRNRNFSLGKAIHSNVVINGLETDSLLACKLIRLHSLAGDLSLATSIFNRACDCNVYLINSMIRGYVTNGLNQRALNLFYQKVSQGVKPDSYTFSCALKACASLSDLQQGKHVHTLALQNGLGSDLFVSNALIAMYGKCGSLLDGVHVFEGMPERDVVSWNSIISAYTQNGLNREAMDMVREFAHSDLRLDEVTVVSSLTITLSPLNVREIHCFLLRKGFESVSMVCNSLISAYGQWGRMQEARRVFDNLIQPDKVSWNSLISSYGQNGFFEESRELLQEMTAGGFEGDLITYSGIVSSLAQNGHPDEAVRTFKEMLSLGLKPDVITVASVLSAMADLRLIHCSKEIHSYSYRNGFESDRRVKNALISVYSKCGFLQNAIKVFREVTNPDVISWSSMVVGYTLNGHFHEALDSFRLMTGAQVEPNPVTITSILSACVGTSSLRQGREVHLWAIKNGFEGQTFVGSALIDMYSKCGRINEARKLFDQMGEKNLVTWNSMISAYTFHGLGREAIEIFKRIEEPDQISFTAALSACNHEGLVDEGIRIFESMRMFDMGPREGHYSCMVNILGRAGRLQEALDLIKEMPMEASADVWAALLGACKIHYNLELGMYAGNRIVELGCEDPGYYVLFSNLLADFGRWGDVEMVRKRMRETGMRKGAGHSWTDVDKENRSFAAGARESHS